MSPMPLYGLKMCQCLPRHAMPNDDGPLLVSFASQEETVTLPGAGPLSNAPALCGKTSFDGCLMPVTTSCLSRQPLLRSRQELPSPTFPCIGALKSKNASKAKSNLSLVHAFSQPQRIASPPGIANRGASRSIRPLASRALYIPPLPWPRQSKRALMGGAVLNTLAYVTSQSRLGAWTLPTDLPSVRNMI